MSAGAAFSLIYQSAFWPVPGRSPAHAGCTGFGSARHIAPPVHIQAMRGGIVPRSASIEALAEALDLPFDSIEPALHAMRQLAGSLVPDEW